MRASAIIAISLLELVGCGSNRGGSVSLISPQVDSRVGSAPLAQQSRVARADGDQPILEVQSLPTIGGVHVSKVRSPVGAPVIYSTTGGPSPDAKRAGHLQIGANVTPLPDWKRPDRWSDPVNGISVSTGRSYDGARAARIAEYVISHIDDNWESQGYANEPTSDTPGLASFPNQPVLRLAEGTSDEHTAYALHAAALINSTLPHNKRILIGPEAPPLVSVDLIPGGQIFVDFAAKSDWIPSSEGTAMSSTDYSWEWVPMEDRFRCSTADDCAEVGRRKIGGMRAGHVWIDPDAFHTQAEFVRVLVHEMLHALGLRGHTFVDQFPESILRNTYSTILPTDNHVPMIDADGLLAIYTRLAPGAEPESLTAANLAPWENESLHMHAELDASEGAVFGVAFRNGLARSWALGPEPLSPVAENQSLRGNATWDGALLGFTPEGSSVAGEAEITVDLGQLTGRADYSELQEWSSPKWQDDGYWSTWGDGDLGYTIVVSGNMIRETGGDEGVLTGSFVGKKHEGLVGTLERQDLSAAFGASIGNDGSSSDDERLVAEAAREAEAEAKRLMAKGTDTGDGTGTGTIQGGFRTGSFAHGEPINPNYQSFSILECSGLVCELRKGGRNEWHTDSPMIYTQRVSCGVGIREECALRQDERTPYIRTTPEAIELYDYGSGFAEAFGSRDDVTLLYDEFGNLSGALIEGGGPFPQVTTEVTFTFDELGNVSGMSSAQQLVEGAIMAADIFHPVPDALYVGPSKTSGRLTWNPPDLVEVRKNFEDNSGSLKRYATGDGLDEFGYDRAERFPTGSYRDFLYEQFGLDDSHAVFVGSAGPIDGDDAFLVPSVTDPDSFVPGGGSYSAYGGWMDHSGFFVVDVSDLSSLDSLVNSDGSDWRSRFYGSYAIAGGFEEARPSHGLGPGPGNVTFRGLMVGAISEDEVEFGSSPFYPTDSVGRSGDAILTGDADLTVNLESQTMTAEFTNITMAGYGYDAYEPYRDVVFEDIGIDGNAFGGGSETRYISGGFYGEYRASEAVGVFEVLHIDPFFPHNGHNVVGAFGAKRQD